MMAERTDEEIAREIAWSANVEGARFSERHAERRRLADEITVALRTARAQGEAAEREACARVISLAREMTDSYVRLASFAIDVCREEPRLASRARDAYEGCRGLVERMDAALAAIRARSAPPGDTDA